MSALYLPQLDAFHVHLAKTGGTTVNSVLRRTDLRYKWLSNMVGTPHTMMHKPVGWIARHLPKYVASRYFGFVRHPAMWYRSRFHASQGADWGGGVIKQERRFKTDSFDRYVTRSCAERTGFYTERVTRYFGPSDAPITYIGLTERVISDLALILKLLGYAKWETVLKYEGTRKRKSKRHDTLTAKHLELIHEAERPVYERFGYDTNPHVPPVYVIPQGGDNCSPVNKMFTTEHLPHN
jgi:hypothetical protein